MIFFKHQAIKSEVTVGGVSQKCSNFNTKRKMQTWDFDQTRGCGTRLTVGDCVPLILKVTLNLHK